MKFSNAIFSFFVLISILSACSKKNTTPRSSNDCEFVQNDADMDGLIDENERTLMDECRTNALTSKSEIENNLIGEWELIGYGTAWVPSLSQPCGTLTFTEEELIFEFQNNSIDTTYQLTWEVEILDTINNNFHRLKTSGEIALGIGTFCEDYMFGDATPRDGNMYLYQKVE